MIVGCYILNLYCDTPGCTEMFENSNGEESLKRALEGAANAGWSVSNGNGGYRQRKHFCPQHRKRVGIDKWGKRAWMYGTITT